MRNIGALRKKTVWTVEQSAAVTIFRSASTQVDVLASVGQGTVRRPVPRGVKEEIGGKLLSRGPFKTGLNKVNLTFAAGARSEGAENLGMTHAMRAGLCSGEFMLTKKLGNLGNLTCTTTREHITYSFETCRPVRSITNTFLYGAHRNFMHELCDIEEIKKAVKLDLALLRSQPNIQVVEALHKAAYKNGGLGNSLYMSDEGVEGLTYEKMVNYMKEMFVPANLTGFFAGSRMKSLPFKGEQWTPYAPSPYRGGEVRVDTKSEIVHAAVVTEGVCMDSSDLLMLRLLQHIMGTESRIKYLVTGRLAKAAARATSAPAAAACINASYYDSGLFGFHMASHYRDAGKVLKELFGVFSDATKGGISDADVKRAKALLRMDLRCEIEDERLQMDQLCQNQKLFQDEMTFVFVDPDHAKAAHQRISELLERSLSEMAGELPAGTVIGKETSKDLADPAVIRMRTSFDRLKRAEAELRKRSAEFDVMTRLDGITTEQVQAMAKKVINSKPTMAAVGNLTYTPGLEGLL